MVVTAADEGQMGGVLYEEECDGKMRKRESARQQDKRGSRQALTLPRMLGEC